MAELHPNDYSLVQKSGKWWVRYVLASEDDGPFDSVEDAEAFLDLAWERETR